jgi:CRP/FNR family cyclic AMP-dependent transcriptional regulator
MLASSAGLSHQRVEVGHNIGVVVGVRLLDIEPDIGRFLSADELTEARQLRVPIAELETGAVDVGSLVHDYDAFGALVVEGIVTQRLRVGEQTAVRLLGPGEQVMLEGSQRSMLLTEASYQAGSQTRLAIIGAEMVVAVRRWPRLAAGLHVRTVEQAERLAAQLVICQLPRVDLRLLAIMWLLAESWGHVTSVGTTLPLSLTHDVLGELVGARRPTVTIALGDLSERGAIVRQDRGWLLVEAPPESSLPPRPIEHPALLDIGPSEWRSATTPSDTDATAALRETVARLREEHSRRVKRHRERVAQIQKSRERSRRTRRAIERDALSRRSAPSS